MNETMTAQMRTILTSLRHLPPRARLRVIALALPEVERDLAAAEGAEDTAHPVEIPHPADVDTDAAAEARFKQKLVEMRLMTEIKTPLSSAKRNLPEPIAVPGTPLSEIIIAERR